MKIYLTSQKKNFWKHLEFFKNSRVMRYDVSRLAGKTTTVEVNSTQKIAELDLFFLFDYKIFPDTIMDFKTQWEEENRKMKVGDTIVQQVYIPPIPSFSQKIIFAVRINEIIDENNRKGFSYETLEGHVEKGISTFTVEESEGKILFTIRTYSAPGNILTRLLGPVFSVPYQKFCTNAALKNVKRQLENL